MIDLSDGLGGDAGHLAKGSGWRCGSTHGALPLANGVAEIAAAAGRDPIQLAVSGGEDYELLATLPAERLEEATGAVRGSRHDADPDRRGPRRRGGRDQAARRPADGDGGVRPAPPNIGVLMSSSRTPRRCSIASATSAGSGL